MELLEHANPALPAHFSAVVVPLACAHCGADMEAVTVGKPQAGTFAAAIVRCSYEGCHKLYEVSVYLRPTGHDARYDRAGCHRSGSGRGSEKAVVA
jgi:hypothetical protein